jgi:hypothetical protein
MPDAERDGRRAFPHLEMLLARADRLVEPVGYAGGLFALFGIESPVGADLPTAAVSFLGDTGEAPAGFTLHADPVQLIPDRDCLLAFDLNDAPLDGDEVAGLVEAFNAHFGDDGIRLYGSRARRLYLRCDPPPSMQTHPLSAVIGRNLYRLLPEGDDRQRWRGLLNETQMLCHALEFNHEREARGRPTLGGLWFSGGGSLPPEGQSPVARLVGDCVLARGLLALRPGVGGDELVIENAPGRAVTRADLKAWLQALAGLEERMPDLLQGCDVLYVHPGNGAVYRWRPRLVWRAWRRKRPLFLHLDDNPEAPGSPVVDKGL